MTLVWVATVLVANWVVGCVVLSLIDRDERVLKWTESSPLRFAPVMVATFWPMVLLDWVMRRRRQA